jgi:hypothetical protein
MPVAVHTAPPGDGQVIVPQAPAAHVTSHAHELPQSMSLHAFAAVQSKVQGTPAPHRRLLHASAVEQVIANELAPIGQMVPSHAPSPMHWIVHA